MIAYKDINNVVRCPECGKIDWVNIDPPKFEGDDVSAECNNCGEWLFTEESNLDNYAQIYDEKMKFANGCPCPECGDIAWIIKDIIWPKETDGTISAKCPTCGHYSYFKRDNLHYGEPKHNDKYMHKNEFLKYYACNECKRVAGWVDVKWGAGILLDSYVSARCSYCGYELYEKISNLRVTNDIHNMIAQMEKMDKRMESLKRSPWNTKYYDSPCPYCGSMKVRPIKWSDKRLSVAFWGIFGSNIGDKYKCDSCKRTWE